MFTQIFDSSIADDYQVRYLFEDLCKLADVEGVVDMTPEAIAARTRVPLNIVKECLTKLEAPDPRSRSPLEEGRRIVRIDSHRDWGWRIVNYEHYRELRDDDARRSYFRDYMREYRAKKKKKHVINSKQTLNSVNRGQPQSTQAEAEAEAEAVRTPPQSVPKPVRRAASYKEGAGVVKDTLRPAGPGGLASFDLFWNAYPKKVKRTDAEHAFVESGAHMGIEDVIRALEIQKRSLSWTKENGRYIPDPSNWLRNQQWLDLTPEMVKQRMEIEKINKI